MTPAMVTWSVGSIPVGVTVVTVTTLDVREIAEMLAITSVTAAGPVPGPTWLTRSKLVPSCLPRNVQSEIAVVLRNIFAAEQRSRTARRIGRQR